MLEKAKNQAAGRRSRGPAVRGCKTKRGCLVSCLLNSLLGKGASSTALNPAAAAAASSSPCSCQRKQLPFPSVSEFRRTRRRAGCRGAGKLQSAAVSWLLLLPWLLLQVQPSTGFDFSAVLHESSCWRLPREPRARKHSRASVLEERRRAAVGWRRLGEGLLLGRPSALTPAPG